jgi:hypothetical protein
MYIVLRLKKIIILKIWMYYTIEINMNDEFLNYTF